jgi:hypothetical protein
MILKFTKKMVIGKKNRNQALVICACSPSYLRG